MVSVVTSEFSRILLDLRPFRRDTSTMRSHVLVLLGSVLLACSGEQAVEGSREEAQTTESVDVKLDPRGPAALLPESDAGAIMDPDRDIHVNRGAQRVRVTELPGAEDGEVLSPDGGRIAFLAAPDGIAGIFVVAIPQVGGALQTPMRLTNQGLRDKPKSAGRMPEGFTPLPETAPLRWLNNKTIAWEAQGRTWTVEVP